MLTNLGWLALAGAIGTLLRYGVSGFVQRFCSDEFPWGTLAANGLGCFCSGSSGRWPRTDC